MISLIAISQTWGEWIGTTSVQVPIMAALVLIVQTTLGRSWAPIWRYAMWAVVLLRLWMPAFLPLPLPAIDVASWLPSSSVQDSSTVGMTSPSNSHPIDHDSSPYPSPWLDSATSPTAKASVAPLSEPTPSSPNPGWLPLLFVTWCVGVVALSTYTLLKILAFRRTFRHARRLTRGRRRTILDECEKHFNCRRRVALYESADVSTPLLCGLWRPAILVPRNHDGLKALSETEWRHVFLHELAHLRGGDLYTNWFLNATRAVYWFHPVVWWALKEFRETRELLRDWQALERDPSSTPTQYAATILKWLTLSPQTPSSSTNAALLGGAPDVERRIRMIAKYHPGSRRARALGSLSLVVLAWISLTGKPISAAPESPPAPLAEDRDTDGDGLSDFHETHKYFTDPKKKDSDGDGRPDGDWSERREYSYTVRSIVHVAPPVTRDVLSDDYQDARILEERDDYVELEVIHYPFNTVATTIQGNPNWRKDAKKLKKWLQPGLTANWDKKMRRELIASMAKDGIDVNALDDVELVQKAARWLLRHANSHDGFSTFCTRFVNGKPQVHPGMESSAEDGQEEKNLTLRQQWDRELFAKGMFENKQRGTCTSSAIYLNGCLRALGIPTRIVLTIPVIDASDPRELELVQECLTHKGVQRIIRRGVEPLGNSWASHTFNEVYVGGRWRRLNYDKLGQNILDPGLFGMITHVATFSDWADGNMASTWGLRQASRPSDDKFGGSNPYSTVALSDQFGVHATLEYSPPKEHRTLTITDAKWFSSPDRPDVVSMRLDDPETAGHIFMGVEEFNEGEGIEQYRDFYQKVGKNFLLKHEGLEDVPARATRGYWVKEEENVRHFYLRIEPDRLPKMRLGVPYRLVALEGDEDYRWQVQEGVTLTRTESKTAPPKAKNVTTLTIDRVIWSDDPESPTGPIPGMGPVLLAHVGPSDEFDDHKAFTEATDRRFFLEADGFPTLKVGTGIGGVTSQGQSYVIISLGPGDWRDLVEGVTYSLRAQNSEPTHQWVLAANFEVVRR